jgi:hypothetical protein
MECCELRECNGRCRKHRNWYQNKFETEYKSAMAEYLRLKLLFKDVCWYTFESVARDWHYPWRQSHQDIFITLHGIRFNQFWNKGKLYEQGEFPLYYAGPLSDAPVVCPTIVLKELQDAREYVDVCEDYLNAHEDWKPGGKRYNRLLVTTRVGKEAKPPRRKRRFSNQREGDE